MYAGPRPWRRHAANMMNPGLTTSAGAASGRASSVMDWNRVAASLPGRTNKDCRKRWVNRLCGERKMGPWDREEDKLLLEAMENYGPRFVASSQSIRAQRGSWTQVDRDCKPCRLPQPRP